MFQSKALIVFSNGGSTALTDNVLILKKSSRRIFVFKWHSSRETNPSVCLSEFLLHFRCVTLVEILNVVFFFFGFFFPSPPCLLQPSELALPQTRNSISSSLLYNAQSIIRRGLLNYTTFQTDELGMPLEKQSAPTTALFVSTPQPITHFMHGRNEYVPGSSAEMCRNMTLQEKNSNSSFIPSVIILLSV